MCAIVWKWNMHTECQNFPASNLIHVWPTCCIFNFCLTLCSPMMDWICHQKFQSFGPVLDSIHYSFVNVIHELESVRGGGKQCQHIFQAFICAVVLTNHSLYYFCECYIRFCNRQKGNCIMNSFTISTCHQIFSGRSKEGRWDGQDTQPTRRWQLQRTYLSENSKKGRDYLGDLSKDASITVNWISENSGMKVWTGFKWLGTGCSVWFLWPW